MTPKNPPKTTRTAPSRARSGGKARGKDSAGRWLPEVRSQAVDLMRSEGMAAAHKETGVPKATLAKWSKSEGIDLGEAARARTAAASEVVRQRAAEVRASTVELLEQHIAQAGEYLSTVAGVNALAAQLIAGADPDLIEVKVGMAGPYAVVNDAAAAELSKVALALGSLPLTVRDAEGVLTRAVHDLQLLRGEATERGELTVEFQVPRPTPPAEVPEIEVSED